MLSKDQIIASADRKTKEVEVPEWGGSVLLAEMSAKDRDDYEIALQTFDESGKAKFNPDNLRSKLVAACIVDENMNRMFTAEELSGKNGKVIDRLFQEATDLNAIDENAIEDAAKN
jgi:hypothetical protein